MPDPGPRDNARKRSLRSLFKSQVHTQETLRRVFSERKTRIVINGKEYRSLQEVPAQYRRYLEDKNRNGIPDFLEEHLEFPGKVAGRALTLRRDTVDGKTTYTVDDKTFTSREAMPVDARRLFEEVESDLAKEHSEPPAKPAYARPKNDTVPSAFAKKQAPSTRSALPASKPKPAPAQAQAPPLAQTSPRTSDHYDRGAGNPAWKWGIIAATLAAAAAIALALLLL